MKMQKQLVDISCGPAAYFTCEASPSKRRTTFPRVIFKTVVRDVLNVKKNKIFLMPAVCKDFFFFFFPPPVQRNRSEACGSLPAESCETHAAPKPCRHLCSLAPGSTDYQGCLEIKTESNYWQAAESSTCLSIFTKQPNQAPDFQSFFLSLSLFFFAP